MSLDDPRWRAALRRRLLRWFRAHARDLPWRTTRDPYAIWVSEIMLQQTQVATVVPYFERFVQAFPSIHVLARAEEQEVLRLWEGLGYYRRARQLHRAARIVAAEHGGRFPQAPQAVESLPGIGRYTAGAILSIAFDARQPILEANTIRVWCRLLAYRGDPRSAAAQKVLWRAAEQALPRRGSGDFNQALMELGSEVCTLRSPACERCPLQPLCPTLALGLQAAIPSPSRATAYEEVLEACVVVQRRRQVLLRRCQDRERWAGLWDFPRFPFSATDEPTHRKQLREGVRRLTGISIEPGARLATLKHGVTRFRITLDCFTAAYRGGRPRGGEVVWVEPADLARYPLSRTARQISRLLVRSAPAD